MQIMTRHLSLAAIVAGLAFSTASTGSLAQQNPAQQPQQQQTPQVDNERLEVYAEAANEVQKLNGEYRAEAETVQNPNELNALREETEAKMIDAIEEKGLSVEEYNQITTAARSDPQLAQRITQMMSESR